MNPKQTIPVLAKLAPVLAAAGPPTIIGAAIGLGLLWLFSGNKKKTEPDTAMPTPQTSAPTLPAEISVAQTDSLASVPVRRSKRIRREDLAEALAYGARSMTRQETVAALQALGFGKTAAYKAISQDGRFSEFIEFAPDGLLQWKG